MLTISEFAQACGLSVLALRRYDEAGLLVPADVDERAGYRRYASEQIPDGVLVRTLRQIGLPLATVGQVRAAPDPAAALELCLDTGSGTRWDVGHADPYRSVARRRAVLGRPHRV